MTQQQPQEGSNPSQQGRQEPLRSQAAPSTPSPMQPIKSEALHPPSATFFTALGKTELHGGRRHMNCALRMEGPCVLIRAGAGVRSVPFVLLLPMGTQHLSYVFAAWCMLLLVQALCSLTSPGSETNLQLNVHRRITFPGKPWHCRMGLNVWRVERKFSTSRQGRQCTYTDAVAST